MEEKFKDLTIRINEIPKRQFDFDGFGWAYEAIHESKSLFRLVVKALRNRSKNRIDYLYKWGLEKVKSIYDNQVYETGKTYCYLWAELDSGNLPEETDCKNIQSYKY